MFMNKRFAVVTPLVASVFLAVSAVTVLAQNATTKASKPEAATATGTAQSDDVANEKLVDLWENMLHNVRIARGDLAKSYAQAILDLKPKAHDVYLLSVKSTDALSVLKDQAAKIEGVKTLTDQILKLIETGYQDDRSNPDQIGRSIIALGGGADSFENASKRLIISGEYAIPQMVQVLADPQSTRIQKERVASVLPRFSRESVNAMAAALSSGNPAVMDEVARALGQIGYRQAAPYLKAVLANPNILDSTKKAVQTALVQLVGKEGAEQSVAQLAYAAALDYYNNDQSLVPGLQTTANVWSWQNERLTYDRVPREIYTDIYAMQLSAMALQADPKFYPAMALWLAADFRREADLPNGAADPTMPANMPSARFFALASPPEILQSVLANGMKIKNSAVTLGAMEALVRTQGAKSLAQPVANGAQPLVEALRYNDRQVR
ncbi:MAG: HEAT repeat domain-containing protein, partial [Planctomycetaceae bacterium]